MGHCDLYFKINALILPNIVNTILYHYLELLVNYDQTLDSNVNVGHYDPYFMF